MAKRGRPAYQPTDKDRQKVRMMAMIGLAEEMMAQIMGIAKRTLRKHFKAELDTAEAHLNTMVAGKLFERCMKGDTTALIFWAKTRLRWRERHDERSSDAPERVEAIEFVTPSGERVDIPPYVNGSGSSETH